MAITITLLGVNVTTFSGENVTDQELSSLYAGAIVKGQCIPSAPCGSTTGCKWDPLGTTCGGNGGGSACFTGTTDMSRTCSGDETYSCNNGVTPTSCVTSTQACFSSAGGCGCTGTGPSTAVGTKTTC